MRELVLEDGIQLRISDGKLRIQVPGRDAEVVTDAAQTPILSLLDHFTRPASTDLSEDFPETSATEVESFIAELTRGGVLSPRAMPWHEHREQLLRRQRELPFLKYDDLGFTVTNCGKENLSPGCRSCKDGRWLSIFASLSCNAACPFCLQASGARSLQVPARLSGWLGLLLEDAASLGQDVSGISASGGDLFVNLEATKRIVSFSKARMPHVYVWGYTNGIAATSEQMQMLADLGMDEIRFNLAACDFAPEVVKKVEQAVRIFPWVCVEVPALKATYEHLVEKGALARLADMGTKQLNLAELRFGRSDTICNRQMGDGEHPLYRPLERRDFTFAADSIWFTYDVLEHAHRRGIDIRINDCSHLGKFAQYSAQLLSTPRLRELRKRSTPPFHGYPAPALVAAPPHYARHSASGVASVVLRSGHGGARPTSASTVELLYVGWLTDGTMFDCHIARETPFRVAVRGLVPGMAECLMEMVAGEKRQVWIPEELAYGGAEGRPRGMLVFEVELLAVA